jgi:hypothetical protein
MEHKDNYAKDLTDFCQKSMAVCVDEAEIATEHVGRILQELSKDAERVAWVSNEAQGMLDKLRDAYDENTEVDELTKNRRQLAESLTQIAKQNKGIGDIMFPMIEVLQFQDRIRQQCENMVKMIALWLNYRIEFENNERFDVGYVEFGNVLLKNTTMIDERELIRTFIEGLDKEVVAEVGLFF